MVQVKEFCVVGEEDWDCTYISEEKQVNEILSDLQSKGNKILDINFIGRTGYGVIVYDTNDMLEDIKCDEGKLKWDSEGRLGISGKIPSEMNMKKMSEIERYYS